MLDVAREIRSCATEIGFGATEKNRSCATDFAFSATEFSAYFVISATDFRYGLLSALPKYDDGGDDDDDPPPPHHHRSSSPFYVSSSGFGPEPLLGGLRRARPLE